MKSMYRLTLILLTALALWLATPEAKGQVFQQDAWTAANWQALIDTARALAQRGTISQRHAAATEQVHRPNRANLFAKYDKAGQGAAFRRQADQYLNANRAALKAIFATERPLRQPSGFPAPLPLPEAVLAPIRGSDALDTIARQSAALQILRDALKVLSQRFDLPAQPPDLAAWTRIYDLTQLYVHNTGEMKLPRDGCQGKDCPLYRFFTSEGNYQYDKTFQRQLLTRHFSETIATAYLTAKATSDAAFTARMKAEREEAQQRLRPPGVTPTIHWGSIIGIVIGVVLLSSLLYLIAWFSRTKQPAPPPLTDTYGKADFEGLLRDLPRPDAFLRGAFLGKSATSLFPERPPLDAPFAPVFTTPEHHTLIVARTRTGKGTRVIVPTLLRYYGSVLTIDPKGENAAITGRARKAHLGQAVHIVNPWHELVHHFGRLGLAPPATYNPLDVLDRDDPNAVAVAQSLAAAVCPSVPGDKDRFWQGSAANVFAAVLLWLTDHPGEHKTLARAREIVSQSRRNFTDNYLVNMAASEAFGGAVREMVSQFIDMADETYSGVMSNLNEGTKFLSDPQVKASTAASSFKMEDLIFGKTTVYLVLPPDRMDTQKTWLRLVLTAAMHAFKRHRFAENRQGRCMFLIDEFAALGRMEDVPRDIATMSGYGLDFTLIVQGLDQLRANYGDSSDTILNNCAYKWFCNVSDLQTAKYVSESLGQKTVRTVGKSVSEGTSKGGASEGESTTFGETGRALMRHEEILNLGRDFAIAFQPAGNPLFLQPIDYWNLEQAFDHMKAAHPNMFWTPPLEFDANPYVAASTAKEAV